MAKLKAAAYGFIMLLFMIVGNEIIYNIWLYQRLSHSNYQGIDNFSKSIYIAYRSDQKEILKIYLSILMKEVLSLLYIFSLIIIFFSKKVNTWVKKMLEYKFCIFKTNYLGVTSNERNLVMFSFLLYYMNAFIRFEHGKIFTLLFNIITLYIILNLLLYPLIWLIKKLNLRTTVALIIFISLTYGMTIYSSNISMLGFKNYKSLPIEEFDLKIQKIIKSLKMDSLIYYVDKVKSKKVKDFEVNAMTISILSKRFILYMGNPVDKTVLNAITAHELKHVIDMASLHLLLMFYVFTLIIVIFYYILYKKSRFEPAIQQNISKKVLVFALFIFLWFTILTRIIWAIINIFRNYIEYSADMYAKKMGYGRDLANTLSKHSQITNYSKTFLFNTIYHDHPSIDLRCKYLTNK